MSDLIRAARLLRQELLIKDEPLKALDFLNALNLPELEEEKNKTFMMVRHMFNYDDYLKTYKGGPFPDDFEVPQLLNADEILPRFKWVFDKVKEQGAKSFLDFGCYNGALALTLAKKLGIKVTGVELTTKAVEYANRKSTELGLASLASFVNNDSLSYEGEKADAVSAMEIIEHVPNPQEFLKVLANHVKPGGWIYITTPNGAIEGGLGNKHTWEFNPQEGGVRGHVRAYNKVLLEKDLEGFEIKELFSRVDHIEGSNIDYLYAQVRPNAK